MTIRFSAIAASLGALALAACGGGEPASQPAPDTAAEPAASDSGGIPAADMVFFGGPIHTADDARPTVGAVAVQDGRIVFAGPRAGANMWVGQDTRLIDLDGAAMYPGFTDSHIHVLGVGQRERLLNLDDVTSVAQLVERVEAAVAAADPGTVVFGRGWIETHWPEGRFPNRTDLDAVSPDNPVVLVRADGHALVANSAALDAAGLGYWRV